MSHAACHVSWLGEKGLDSTVFFEHLQFWQVGARCRMLTRRCAAARLESFHSE